MDKNSKLLIKINFTESYTSYNVLTFLPDPTYDLTMLQKNNEVLSILDKLIMHLILHELAY